MTRPPGRHLARRRRPIAFPTQLQLVLWMGAAGLVLLLASAPDPVPVYAGGAPADGNALLSPPATETAVPWLAGEPAPGGAGAWSSTPTPDARVPSTGSPDGPTVPGGGQARLAGTPVAASSPPAVRSNGAPPPTPPPDPTSGFPSPSFVPLPSSPSSVPPITSLPSVTTSLPPASSPATSMTSPNRKVCGEHPAIPAPQCADQAAAATEAGDGQ